MDTVARPTPLDLRAVFESIVHILPSRDDAMDVEFMVVIAPSVPSVLLLDETYIHRIFMNLLSNALKFTTSGYVLLSIEYNGHELVAQVQDTGIGIPRIFIPRLFEPFSQAQTQGSQRGTGLGLSIIKQLLHKMDGVVSVESQHAEDKENNFPTGTTVTVTLPAQSPPSSHNDVQTWSNSGDVAAFPRNVPTNQKGQRAAWEHFGCKVIEISKLSDLDKYPNVKYIWVDDEYLQQHPDCLEALLLQKTWTVLVPYSNQEEVHRIPGVMSTSRFVPLLKPLMWHTFESRVALSNRSSPDVLERSTSKGRLLDVPKVQAILPRTTEREVTILLVEDNLVRYFPLQRKVPYLTSSVG
jgi:hypothetical protein